MSLRMMGTIFAAVVLAAGSSRSRAAGQVRGYPQTAPGSPGAQPPSDTPATPASTIPAPPRTRPPDGIGPGRPGPADSVPLSGKVTMEDGTPPPEPVRIDSVCGGRASILSYTDAKGGFSGSNSRLFSDARTIGSRRSRATTFNLEQPAGSCSLRAFLPGYRSTEVDLEPLQGTFAPIAIVLHRMANVEGRTVSATTLEAPKPARSAFEKGARALRQHKWDQAEAHLERAVRIYPRYAVAWSGLGNARAALDRPEDARKAFREALAIDPKFIDPYFGLAELAMHQQRWQEMAELTGALVKLDPYDFPGAWAYDAMAHLRLGHLDAAEKSARQGLRIDTLGEVPKTEHLLGVILMRKGDFEGAAGHLNKYLEAAPGSSDAELVKQQLAACAERQTARAGRPDAGR